MNDFIKAITTKQPQAYTEAVIDDVIEEYKQAGYKFIKKEKQRYV